MQPFVTRVGAKWILVGEHSVLRGGAAIAFPCSDFSLELKYEPGPTSLDPGIRRLLDLLGGPNHVSGDLQIRSTIPQGAGLGSSAALSVALTRWAIAQGLVPATTGGDAPLEVTQRDAQIERLATQLEHHFHGTSSGMDVAVVARAIPLCFIRSNGGVEISPLQYPRAWGERLQFTLHDTGSKASTRDCVGRVNGLFVTDPPRARRIDSEMQASVSLAQECFRRAESHPDESIARLGQAMRQAQGCFEDWGLVPHGVPDQIQDLESRGALAVKLTGAGGGGMLLALWDRNRL